MARMGSFSASDLKRLQKELNKLEIDAFCAECAKELAARLLARVIKRTPVGKGTFAVKRGSDGERLKYKRGKNAGKYKKVSVKQGGTLRRGWTAQQGSGSGAAQYIDTLTVNHFGDTYVIEITNPVEYASYVEFGHRKRGGKGWVAGRFFMTISEQEIEQITPALLKQKINKYLGGAFH